MDPVLQQALNKMIEDLNLLIEELSKNPLFEKIKMKKNLINEFSIQNGGNIIYSDIDEGKNTSIINNIFPGKFKGLTLARAVREYLEMRGKDNPPTFLEIKEALKQGDFDSTKIKDIRKNMLKNNQLVLLSGDHFGLTKWYDRPKRKDNKVDNQEEEIIDDGEDEIINNEENKSN